MPQDIDINRIQYAAIIGSVLFFVFIVALIRNKRLKEEYSLLWLSLSIVFIVFSIWRDGLVLASHLLGIDYPPSALFLFLLIGVIFILIQFSVLISKLSEQNKVLTQELGLLKMEMKKIKDEVDKLKS
ncbi:MAG: DUF2304 domain-containing protein [Candidatus Aminicenantes bacterium]|jgi:hypothetical protein